MKALLFTALVLIFLLDLLMQRALNAVSPKELKRRARNQDIIAQRIYKLAAYGPGVNLFLWLVASAGLAGLVVWTAGKSPWTAAFEVFVATWLLWFSRPLKKYGSSSWKLASYLAIPRAKLMSWLHPVFGRIASRFSSLNLGSVHTGVYEKADLLELLNYQNRLVDNRVPETDLKIAFHALQFGDKTVGSVMKPRKAVKWVSEDEPVGPLLMDELHASGMTEFPVVKDSSKKSANPEIVGTLYLTDLIGQTAGGKARERMQTGSHTIAETKTLREALAEFSKSRQHLLVVVNNFDEVVGVLSFGQLMEQILGERIPDDAGVGDNNEAKPGKALKSEEPQANKA